MSFYNFKLNDPSVYSSSNNPNSKLASRFVNKTVQDYTSTNQVAANSSEKVPKVHYGSKNIAAGRWEERGIVTPEVGESRFNTALHQAPLSPPVAQSPLYNVPEEIHTVSITSSLQGITHTYSPVSIATLHGIGHSISVRLAKLSGQSTWHSHGDTDKVFIVFRGGINILYLAGSGIQRVARVVAGELLCVPMKMEHCIVADEGTEVLLLEGNGVL